MSIAQQITRIQQDRNTIRAKLVELGLATNLDNLDVLAQAIEDIENKGSVSAQVKEGETYTIPAGYHDGSGTVSGVAGGGNYTLQSKAAITPTKKQQQITPDDGYYGLSDVTIAAIPDAYQDVTAVTAAAADVLTGKTIVNSAGDIVPGTMANNSAVSKTLDAGSSYTIPKGYHNGNGKVTAKSLASQTEATATASNIMYGSTAYVDGEKITGTMPLREGWTQRIDAETTSIIVPEGYHDGTGSVFVNVEEKLAMPTKVQQTITPSSGKVLSKVTVAAIPAGYITTTDATATADSILQDQTAYVNGEKITGTMANNGAVSTTLDGLTATSVTIPAGYTTGGTISLTSDIEEALAAI